MNGNKLMSQVKNELFLCASQFVLNSECEETLFYARFVEAVVQCLGVQGTRPINTRLVLTRANDAQ